VLISVKPAFGFRNLPNCLLRVELTASTRLLAGANIGAHVSHLERNLDSQGPPESFSPHCEIEAFRCGVQPSATPWQPEPRIRNNSGQLLTIVATVRHNSQQC
jgi:hypothetical protein